MDRRKKIQVEDLVLIHGPNAARAERMLTEGVSREDIHRSTGATVAVRGVSFDVYERELLVIMGLSGSGKSSLIKCLNRLNAPSSGSIRVDGEDILAYDTGQLRRYRQRTASMVFQNFGLLPGRTVLRNVEFGLEASGVKRGARRQRAMEMIGLVGLQGWESSKPRELSGGMQQRVGLARALACDPEILLMDEPFSALDPLIRRQMQRELLHLQGVLKKTIVFITHDVDEAFLLGDRIAIMKDGEFQQTGRPSEILEAPATPYVEEFIRDIDRAKVYRAGDVAVHDDAAAAYEATVPFDARMEDVLAMLSGCSRLGVEDREGRVIGYVDRDIALRIFAPPSSQTQEP